MCTHPFNVAAGKDGAIVLTTLYTAGFLHIYQYIICFFIVFCSYSLSVKINRYNIFFLKLEILK